MKSLVTGGLGFIGRHLVRLLRSRGEAVRVLDIAPGRFQDGEVEVIQGSIGDADTVYQALQGVDRLYHLAGNPNLWARDKSVFAAVNHQGTRTVLEQAGRVHLERIVYTSTESILVGKRRRRSGGDADPCDGTTLPRLEDMPGPYCRSKYLAEQEALAAARRGLPVVIVSPTMPIGPEDFNLTPPTRMLLGFLNRGIPAYLECGMNLVDVRDVAHGHLLAAEKGRIGERYVLGHANLMLSEFLGIIHDLTDVAVPVLRVPYPLALGFAAASEFVADRITRRPPVAPLTGVRLAAARMFFDCTKAVQELGFAQTPIRKTLSDAVNWLVDAGLVRRPIRRPGEESG